MTVTLPMFLIPLALSGLLYLFCGIKAGSGYGLTGMVDGLMWAVVWVIGTLMIWIIYLILMLVGVA